ncbi:MAG: hypothetical protein M3460_12055 [Actinomycetota bacterium]|nr:hypothetical protein [Actinomycetota bacterium]
MEFRNDLSREQGIDLVCDTVGEVDIVTEVPPSAAERVRSSRHARLVAVNAVRALAGRCCGASSSVRCAGGLPRKSRGTGTC